MKNQIRYNYSLNPAISMIPVLIYSLLINFINDTTSLFVGMISSLVLIFVDYLRKKNVSHPILLVSFFISFLFCFIYSLLRSTYINIIFEIVLVFQLMFLLINKNSTLKILFNKQYVLIKSNRNIILEYFHFVKRLTIVLSAYVLIYLINSLLYSKNIAVFPNLNSNINIISGLMYLFLFVYQIVRVKIINSYDSNEEWLPILDSNMNVIGRIAKSLSLENKDQCLHPRIRILAFYNGRLLLKSIDASDISAGTQFDTPYSKDIVYGEQITAALNHLVNKNGLKNERISFVTRYLYESEQIRRVVFLYIVHIKDESIIQKKSPIKAKFWTESELANNLNKKILGDFVEYEYEFINSIIYPAMKLMNENGFNNDTWADSVGEDLTSSDSSL